MWHIPRLLVASLAAVATAAITDGSIFIFDSETTTSQALGSISDDAAKLLLQQRMQATGFAASAALGEPVLELLNNFGGEQHGLFDEPHKGKQSLLVIIEGLTKDAGAIQPSSSSAALRVPRISSDFLDTSMFENLLASSSRAAWSQKQCDYEADTDAKVQVENSYKLQGCLRQYTVEVTKDPSQAETLARLPSFTVEAWQNKADKREIMKVTFSEESKDQSAVGDFLEFATQLFSAPQQAYLLLPKGISSSNNSNKNKSFGKRSSNLLDHTRRAPQKSSSSELPSALLPVCYASNSSCASSTNDCSGHGTCYLKSGSSKDNNECYACRCHSTTVTNTEDGTVRTVKWGGAACQKEDISTQFFLLASISVLAILAVGAGVGMLFSVGEQELPSVISAGVSAPKGAVN